MKKALLLVPMICVSLALPGFAEQLNVTSYYPAPSGTYQNITFSPQTNIPTSNCQIGSIFANANDSSKLYFCSTFLSTTGIPEFAPFPGPWTFNGSELYLTDTSTPLNKKIGIGTLTPSFKLTLANDGGILADNGSVSAASSTVPSMSISGAMLVWHPYFNGFRAGSFTNLNLASPSNSSFGDYSLAFGHNNIAASTGTSIWGGSTNSAGVQPIIGPALVLGYEVIGGGKSNSIGLNHGQIIGGENNIAQNYAIAGGKNNTAGGSYDAILGGESNSSAAGISVIAGGQSNSINGLAAAISGGFTNTINSDYATIVGGHTNTVHRSSSYSTVSGGFLNSHINATHGYVLGGYWSGTGNGNYSVAGAGYLAGANGNYSTVGGSYSSGSTGYYGSTDYSSVIGGWLSYAEASYSTIPAADYAAVYAPYAIGTGEFTTALGDYSFVGGGCIGTSDQADRTFVYGKCTAGHVPLTQTTTADAFIIQNLNLGIRDKNPAALVEINTNASTDDFLNLTSTAAASSGNIFKIINNGNVGVGVTSPAQPLIFANGAYVSTTGNFVNASSREYKTNISSLSINEAMEAFSKLQPVHYKYKSEPEHEYIGFIAEDVPELVATEDRVGLSPMDITAVLSKVISNQQEILSKQKQEVNKLIEEVNSLKTKIKSKNQQP